MALWSTWLSWLGVILQSKRLRVLFPAWAHAWVAVKVRGQGLCLGHMFFSGSFSLPPPLSKNKWKQSCKKWQILCYIYFTTIKNLFTKYPRIFFHRNLEVDCKITWKILHVKDLQQAKLFWKEQSWKTYIPDLKTHTAMLQYSRQFSIGW